MHFNDGLINMEKHELVNLYYAMRRIRIVEAVIADNYYNDIREMHTPIHLCDGEEAIAVGVCSNLNKEDMIFGNHRSHGHYLAKGGSLDALIAELHSKETGCCKGKGGSMHLCDLSQGIMLTSAIVAGNVSVATGYAMANKLRNSQNITVVFFGDGASEEGSVYESISYAVKMKLPILYVCENNRVAISTPFELREPKDSVRVKFESILPSETVDGNDVEKVSLVSEKMIEKVRSGEGPFLLECETYRLRAHSNIGNGVDGKYRTEEDISKALLHDPLLILKSKLIKNDFSNIEELDEMDIAIREEIKEAFSRAREARLVDKNELYTDVFEEH